MVWLCERDKTADIWTALRKTSTGEAVLRRELRSRLRQQDGQEMGGA